MFHGKVLPLQKIKILLKEKSCQQQQKKKPRHARQQKMVKESLTRALDEVAEAKRTGKKLMSFDDFLKEVNK